MKSGRWKTNNPSKGVTFSAPGLIKAMPVSKTTASKSRHRRTMKPLTTNKRRMRTKYSTMETRSIKSDFKSNGNKIGGSAVVFDSPTRIVGEQPKPRGFTEVVKPGSLRISPDLRLLWSHDVKQPLGTLAKGTLRATIDSKGLYFEADLPESAVREKEAIARGDADGMSFRFGVIKEKWTGDTRELQEIAIDEISITAFPAYKETSVAMRDTKVMEMQLQLREKC